MLVREKTQINVILNKKSLNEIINFPKKNLIKKLNFVADKLFFIARRSFLTANIAAIYQILKHNFFKTKKTVEEL